VQFGLRPDASRHHIQECACLAAHFAFFSRADSGVLLTVINAQATSCVLIETRTYASLSRQRLHDDLTLWCNEEGKLIGLTPNVIGTHLYEKNFAVKDVIMGDIVFTGGTDDEGDNLGLPFAWQVQLQELADKLRKAYEAESELSLLDIIFWSA
jgi:hypothetical protein